MLHKTLYPGLGEALTRDICGSKTWVRASPNPGYCTHLIFNIVSSYGTAGLL
jgi:hypothetical protein